MTRLANNPAEFAHEALEGFVAAHRRWVRQVPGGVVRTSPKVPGHVGVVVGGGSGHYPAFAGLVGPGLAHGAVVGNVFASPSAQQVCSVARAVSAGGGVLLLLRQLRRRRAALRPRPGAAATPTASYAVRSRSPTTSPARAWTRRPSAAVSPETWRSSRSPRQPPTPGTTSTRWSASPPRPTSAPARSGSPSPAARSPAPRTRCSRSPNAGCRSAWASTASPASTDRDPHRRRAGRAARHDPARRASRRRQAGQRVASSSTASGRQVRGAVRRLPPGRPSCWTRRSARSSTREVGELVTSFDMAGSVTDPVLARRRARAAVDRPRRHAGLPQGAVAVAEPATTACLVGRRRDPDRCRRPLPRSHGRATLPRSAAAVGRRRSGGRREVIDTNVGRAGPHRCGRRRRRPRHRHAARFGAAAAPRARDLRASAAAPGRCCSGLPTRGRTLPAARRARCGESPCAAWARLSATTKRPTASPSPKACAWRPSRS